MIPWITTRSFIIDLTPNWTKTAGDSDWSMGRISVDLGTVHERLERLVEDLNADQWEIKFIQPLEKGVTYHEHQKIVQAANRRQPETTIGAIGLGWGSQVTSGYMVIAQRTEYLTQEEYIKRRDERNVAQKDEKSPSKQISSTNDRVNREISKLQNELTQVRSHNAIQMHKTGLLRGEKYVFEGKEFGSFEEADKLRSEKIIAIEEKLSVLMLELKPID